MFRFGQLLDGRGASGRGGRILDAAHRDTATRIAVNTERAAGAGVEPVVSVVVDREGKARLRTKRLEPVGDPRELVELHETVAAILPRVDLPEVLLEVHSWTGFLAAFTHVTEQVTSESGRVADVELSVAACLVADGCNLEVLAGDHAGQTPRSAGTVCRMWTRTTCGRRRCRRPTPG